MKIAVLDDYQNVAREFADFTPLEADHDVTIFNEHLGDGDAVVAALATTTSLPRCVNARCLTGRRWNNCRTSSSW